jgi:hypothetical protein
MKRFICNWIGHDWDGQIDPKCRRCGHELADDTTIGGNVYMGWGRYGYVTPKNSTRDPADVEAELRRINDMPSWRP